MKQAIIILILILLGSTGCTTDDTGRKVVSSKPNEKAVEDSSDRASSIVLVDQKIREREQLRAEGKYDCCTDPGCLECVTDRKNCACYLNIKAKDPICGECLTGYKEGKGKLKLVSIPELEKRNVERKDGN